MSTAGIIILAVFLVLPALMLMGIFDDIASIFRDLAERVRR